MSATVRERDRFIYDMATAGVPLHVARKVLRYGATLQRLAEASCNGDWPADNGTKERKVEPCSRCEMSWVPSSLVWETYTDHGFHAGTRQRRRICKDCRTADLVTLALAPYGLKAFFAGDPRGAVVSVVQLDVPRDLFESGWTRGIAVPC